MSRKIPVLLLTGFLGSGKTTLLNRLLASPAITVRHPALILNEFGPVGIDAALLRPDGYGPYEINRGSLFCTCTKAQLVQTLDQIARHPEYDLVLIESTGIAETRNLEGLVAVPDLTAAFVIQANLCVVDAENFIKIAPFLSLALTQVKWADGLVINKADQVSPAELTQLAAVLRDLNPRAPQVQASFGRIPDAFWQGLTHQPAEGRPVTAIPAEISAITIQTERQLDRGRFLETLHRLGDQVLRLKGNIAFVGEGRKFVELAGGRLLEKEACPDLVPATVFTIIGWRLSTLELRLAFEAAFGPGQDTAAAGLRHQGEAEAIIKRHKTHRNP